MEIIAHRGASADAPENTLAAFRLAIAQQADGWECDVHLSADGRVMVHHDEDAQRSAGRDVRLAAAPAEALRRLDVGGWRGAQWRGETMPLLEQVLALLPAGQRLLVEVKCGAEAAGPLARALAGRPGAMVSIISFDRAVLEACRESMPGVPTMLVAEPEQGESGYRRELIDYALEYGHAGLDVDHRWLDQRFCQAAHAAGLLLYTWTVNRVEDALRLRALGIAGVTSDRPGALRAEIAAAGPHA